MAIAMPPQEENQNPSADRYIGLSKAKARISSWDALGRYPCPVGFFDFCSFSSSLFSSRFVFSGYGVSALSAGNGMEWNGTSCIIRDCIAYFGLNYRILLVKTSFLLFHSLTQNTTCHYVVDKVRKVSTKIQVHFSRSILMLIFILGSWRLHFQVKVVVLHTYYYHIVGLSGGVDWKWHILIVTSKYTNPLCC